MYTTYERTKLINTILYFAHHTKYLGKVKLFKLLYLLDFEHFKQTGCSVTELEYSAWKFGPVPVEIIQEWDDLEPDLAAAITISPESVYNSSASYIRENVLPKVAFDESHFTKRELRIMADLADNYREAYSPQMIDVTHAENSAWTKIWDNGKGSNQLIPYTLAISDDYPYRDAILEAAQDYAAIRQAAIARAA